MKIKDGVNIAGLKSEMILGCVIINDYLNKMPVEFVITSGTDGKHGIGSLHYVGLAVDVRIRDLRPDILQGVVTDLKNRLGVQFDVVLEQTHIHVEYQPK